MHKWITAPEGIRSMSVSLLRWRSRSDGGGPREAGGVYRATCTVPSWCAVPSGSHAAVAGEHGPEAHVAHRLHTPQHTQHFLWAVTTEYPNIPADIFYFHKVKMKILVTAELKVWPVFFIFVSGISRESGAGVLRRPRSSAVTKPR